MIVQEGRPVLSPWPSRAHLPHVFLNGAFADAKTELEQFAPDPLRTPEPILHCHFLNQRHGLCGYLWFGSSCSGFVLPIQLKSLAMPARDPSRAGQ